MSGPRAIRADRVRLVHVLQSEHVISGDANVTLTAVLGSCVAACMRDPNAAVGGMNHFLLPGMLGEDEGIEGGVHAMELLINALLHAGARRERLEVKLFGGARMMSSALNIGERNASFARDFLRQEGIACRGASLGGDRARRLRYMPVHGQVKQLFLGKAARGVFAREMRSVGADAAVTADVEFFT